MSLAVLWSEDVCRGVKMEWDDWRDPQGNPGWGGKRSQAPRREGGRLLYVVWEFIFSLQPVMSPPAALGTELFVILAGSVPKCRGAHCVTGNARNR